MPFYASPLDVDGVFYFGANDGVNGAELWSSDMSTTGAGTGLVADIAKGPTSSSAAPKAVLHGKLFLVADDGATGGELWALDLGRPSATLLRNASVSALDPPAPPLASLLPLDPARDAYRPGFVAGDVDPDPGVLEDPSRPLVFYALDEVGAVLRLSKAAAGEVRIQF